MDDNVENLMLEHLRAMRAQMARMEEKIDTVAAEMLIMRQHTAGLVGTQALHEQRFTNNASQASRRGSAVSNDASN